MKNKKAQAKAWIVIGVVALVLLIAGVFAYSTGLVGSGEAIEYNPTKTLAEVTLSTEVVYNFPVQLHPLYLRKLHWYDVPALSVGESPIFVEGATYVDWETETTLICDDEDYEETITLSDISYGENSHDRQITFTDVPVNTLCYAITTLTKCETDLDDINFDKPGLPTIDVCPQGEQSFILFSTDVVGGGLIASWEA